MILFEDHSSIPLLQDYEIFTRDFMVKEPTELGTQIMSVLLTAALKNVFKFLRAIEEPGKIRIIMKMFYKHIRNNF